MSEMPKAYDPKAVEPRVLERWFAGAYHTQAIVEGERPFTIAIPPPNVTGSLHMGHALNNTIQDVLIRRSRMTGRPTRWILGTDHAGIATQNKVEQKLAREGLSRYDVGRERFVELCWEWRAEHGSTIISQLKAMGCSCDYSDEHFTMDEDYQRAVKKVFVDLFREGLIYRGKRIINWCPRCGTALSDLEVEHRDTGGHLWYIRYPVAGENGKYITVATTRPETMLGDTAVAVNPKDERYQGMVGKRLVLPLMNREIPVVADELVSVEFGTGAVKVTPAHDPVDFEIAQRHGLALINILNPDATMNASAGRYQGMERYACRRAVVADLEREGLLEKIEPYTHAVGHCQRCQTTVEPIASKQWFVRMEPLARPAIEAVRTGEIRIIPERFTKVYLNWMENIRDWCISRQIWWGHRIPIWYCRRCGGLTVEVDTPTTCSKCGSSDIYQDEDTLDTWFSSGLWAHSTLGWPDDTEDFRYFYPTSVMETAYDNLLFWVARMIILGIENTGKVPFRVVYLHGLIRDETGDKISKSKGNVIDPLDLMTRYGTDALRFALTTGTSPGNDSRISTEKLEASRNFANKLWNATRFVVRSLPDQFNLKSAKSPEFAPGGIPTEDRWIISRLNRTVNDVNSLMEDFQFGEAERQLHDFIWNEYCDWYIELAKIRLQAGDSSPLPVLVEVLQTTLRLLHPYMPFITEELWHHLRAKVRDIEAESIMIAPYPAARPSPSDPSAESEMETLTGIIRTIRNARAEYRVPSQQWVEAKIHTTALSKKEIPRYTEAVRILARANPVQFVHGETEEKTNTTTLVLPLPRATVVIPMASMVDPEKERSRLTKELEQTEAVVLQLEKRLGDEAFLTRAPQAVIEKERQKLYTLKEKLVKLRQQLAG
ncbi:MAG: valine--tRNA ligase [Coriobacteriia bacterium]|nr:valine--tRNA ligase [Coriobacteriia bacterium]